MNNPIESFLHHFSRSLQNQTFVKISMGKPVEKDGKWIRASVKKIVVKNNDVLNFVLESKTQTFTENYSPEESVDQLEKIMAHFKSCNLFTTEQDISLQFSRKLVPRLIKGKPTFQEIGKTSHNREKKRLISSTHNTYLRELGVTNKQGTITPKMQNKYKQINKYIEVLNSLIRSSELKEKHQIKITDMGSGKGYLTFALYDYLINTLAMNPEITGVEYRKDLVEKCNNIAGKSDFKKLQFIEGTIENHQIDQVDMLIALHACDTATDDAIAKGIHGGASIIVTAPCCHKQIRKEMDANNILKEITRYGIQKERQAEMITDTIRALLLEAHGYRTEVFEFISDFHTHKNVMITAVKTKGKPSHEVYKEKIGQLKELFGIGYHHLERLLD